MAVRVRVQRDRLDGLADERAWAGLALAAIVSVAALLRLAQLHRVPPDPFYDAAVRTMGGSWHAFLVGALEPGARVAIDKPPVDLWLQVGSTKLFGFDRLALQLPIVLAGLASVVLLYDAVRLVAGRAAGLASALVLALLPIAVLTERSDTMDGVMAALLVLSAWLIVRAARGRKPWLLWAAGAAAGLAFDVKLLEAAVAVPALAVLAVVGWEGGRRHLLGMAAAFVVVALAWLGAISLVPAGRRPWALGSAHGSAWDAALVYNGLNRLRPPRGSIQAGVSANLTAAGPTRLLSTKNPGLGTLAGWAAVAAAAFGIPALALAGVRAVRRDRLAAAGVLALVVWLGCGVVVLSTMRELHARYVEELAPALAAAVGVGVVALARATMRRRWVAFACAGAAGLAAAVTAYAVHDPRSARVLFAAAVVGLAVIAAAGVATRRLDWRVLAAACLAAALVIPTIHDTDIVTTAANDAGQAGLLPAPKGADLSAYLRAHQAGARDEAAVDSVYLASGIVVRDDRPLRILDDENNNPLLTVPALANAVARGDVHTAVLGAGCFVPTKRPAGSCALEHWVVAHGTDVTAAAGLPTGPRAIRVYRLGAP